MSPDFHEIRRQKLVILADDFTGAGDSAVTFARCGRRTALLLDNSELAGMPEEFDAIALSSESRFLDAAQAEQIVYETTRQCLHAGDAFFFKKIDSAMRGNPGPETAAALRALRYPAALVCPALPAAGRVVVDGELLVNGRPLHATSLGKDPFTPVASGNVPQRMTKETGLKAGLVRTTDIAKGGEALLRHIRQLLDDGCGIVAADAVTDSDLAALAELVFATHGPGAKAPPLLPVGSSGLARAMAGPSNAAAAEPKGRLLAIIGSLDGMALRQAEHACGRGLFIPVRVDIASGLDDFERECARVQAETEKAGNAAVLLRSADAQDRERIRPDEGSRVARLYGQLAACLCRRNAFEAIYATGGSTAVAVAQALGLKRLVVENEILPGVVVSSCAVSGAAVRRFVSKAGSFGEADALTSVASLFNGKGNA